MSRAGIVVFGSAFLLAVAGCAKKEADAVERDRVDEGTALETLLPAEADMVLGIDLDQARNARELAPWLQMARNAAAGAADPIARKCQLDLFSDVRRAVAALIVQPDTDAVVVAIETRVTRGQVNACARALGAVISRDWGDHPVIYYIWRDLLVQARWYGEQRVVLRFPRGAGIAPELSALLARPGARVTPELQPLWNTSDRDAVLWFVGKVNRAGEALQQAFPGAFAGTLALSVREPGLSFDIGVAIASHEQAEHKGSSLTQSALDAHARTLGLKDGAITATVGGNQLRLQVRAGGAELMRAVASRLGRAR